MKLTVAFNVQKVCPYQDEVDTGRAEVTYDVSGGDGPELHDLSRELERKCDAVADQPKSHEAFTRWLLHETGARDVVTRWRTADLDVVVEAGPWDLPDPWTETP